MRDVAARGPANPSPPWVEVIDADETGGVTYRLTPAGIALIKTLLRRARAVDTARRG
jgi:hypothetical protein